MHNHKIEAIFFDFGGVFLQTFDGVDHDGIEAEFGLEEKALRKCVYRDSRYAEFQVGGCSYEEWTESIRQAMARLIGGRADALLKAFQESPRTLNSDMIDLVRRLHGRYKLGVISNTIPGMVQRTRDLNQSQPPERRFIHLFDVIIGSGDLGIAKPDAGIFLHAIESLGVSPQNSVFTDDYEKHVKAARALGMHAFHFTSYDHFVEDLRSVGVAA